MPSPDVRIANLAERRHSVLSTEQALACGLSQRQLDYRLSSGRAFVARPDLSYPSAKIYIECDSTKWHGSKQSLARDHTRQNRLAAEGWLPFVVDDTQLYERPDELVAGLRRALATRSAGRARLNGKGSPDIKRGGPL